MTRQITTQGSTLHAALVDAIAELTGADPRDVDLDLSAPGLEDVSGRVRLELDVQQEDEGDADERDDEADDVEADAGPGTRAADSRDDGGREPEGVSPEDLDEEADAAADFLEGLLDAMDLPGDLRIRVKDDHAEVELIDVGSGALIGRRGQTLESVQELVRCALQRRFERRARVQVDVEGYRARRLEKLIEKAEEAIDAVLDSGEPERLEPMDVFERKVIHQLVADVEGLSSRSQGREPGRRVVIEPI
jgi:spoIIIJ-associated protein